MRFLLARHGQTRWNVEEVFRGRADIELDETGVHQAELLGEHLKVYPLEMVCSSPLKRALRTAEIIAAYHGRVIHVCPELTDMDFGGWEGLSAAAVREKYPEDFNLWSSYPEKVRFPGGESLAEVQRRALALVERLAAAASGNVLVVSHRVVLKVLTLAWLGLDVSRFWNIRLDTCGLTTFGNESGRLVLIEHNNTSFLKSLNAGTGKDF